MSLKNDVVISKQKETLEKYERIFLCYQRWVVNMTNNIYMVDFLKKNRLINIAIYGFGTLGEALYWTLKDSEINISYIIEKDKNKWNRQEDIPFYSPEYCLPKVDAVVITAITYYDEIIKLLSQKLDCPLVSLEDIIV